MFAYVRYIDDRCKEIVPTSYSKDFDSKYLDINKIYWVRWKKDFVKGQILFLKGDDVSNSSLIAKLNGETWICLANAS